MSTPITFKAILAKVSTTADGGWRVTLDVAECDREAVLTLSKFRELLLAIAIVPDETQPLSGAV